jgi:hypothetical protein
MRMSYSALRKTLAGTIYWRHHGVRIGASCYQFDVVKYPGHKLVKPIKLFAFFALEADFFTPHHVLTGCAAL